MYLKRNMSCYSILPARIKIEKVKKLADNLHNKRDICYKHKKFKSSLKSWASVKKGTESD